jgi:hypothetical protein
MFGWVITVMFCVARAPDGGACETFERYVITDEPFPTFEECQEQALARDYRLSSLQALSTLCVSDHLAEWSQHPQEQTFLLHPRGRVRR